jgi:hypothetical protein
VSDHLLIDDTTVVTMNPAREVLDHASVAISGERIAEVGAAVALPPGIPPSRQEVPYFTISCSGSRSSVPDSDFS